MPGPFVLDHEHGFVSPSGGSEVYMSTFRREFECVAQEVAGHLQDAPFVHVEGEGGLRWNDFQSL